MKLGASIACCVLCWGCSSEPDQSGFAVLGVVVENQAGGAAEIACEPLPFLPGSHRLTEYVIEGAFTVTLFSSLDAARLSFDEDSVPLADDLQISREALQAEYETEIAVLLSGGDTFVVRVASGCAP